MRRFLKNWSTPIPVYVTRKDAHGETGTWTLSAWMGFLIIVFAGLAGVLWSAIALVEAVMWMIGWFT